MPDHRSSAAEARPLAVFGAAGLALLIWGGTPIVTKIAVARVDPVIVGFLRTAIPAAIALPLVAAFWSRLTPPGTWRERRLLAASGLGGFVFFPLLFSVGLRYTTASHAALILAAAPIFTGLFAALAERRLPPTAWWLGSAIALAGEIFLIGFRLGYQDHGATVGGDLLMVAAAAAAAMGYVAGARLSTRIGTWSTTFLGIVAAGLVLAPALVWQGASVAWSAVRLEDWLAILYLGALSTVLGYVCWYWALARGGIARIGATQFTLPIIILGLAALVLGETITLPLVLATAVILSGVYIVQRR
jgi:drug/metabolite transporter (DMT)-like permease